MNFAETWICQRKRVLKEVHGQKRILRVVINVKDLLKNRHRGGYLSKRRVELWTAKKKEK